MVKVLKEKMTAYIKVIVVPEIKVMGFSGTFPHFRREKHNRFEFLSFQFNRYGGSFVVECGFATNTSLPEFAQKLPFNKLNYGYARPKDRLRIKPDKVSGEDFWFSYTDFSREEEFKHLAEGVKSLLPKVEQFLKR